MRKGDGTAFENTLLCFRLSGEFDSYTAQQRVAAKAAVSQRRYIDCERFFVTNLALNLDKCRIIYYYFDRK